jgi:hypothetical protein
MYLLSLRLISLNPHDRVGVNCIIDVRRGAKPPNTTTVKKSKHPPLQTVISNNNPSSTGLSVKKSSANTQISKKITFFSPCTLLHINVFHFAFKVCPKTVLLALQWSPLILTGPLEDKDLSDNNMDEDYNTGIKKSGGKSKNNNNDNEGKIYVKPTDFIGASQSLYLRFCFCRTPLLALCMWVGFKQMGGESKFFFFFF